MATSKLPSLFTLLAVILFSCFSATLALGVWGQGGQQQQRLQQQLQQCQLRCVSQGQSPQQCVHQCIQQLSGGGSGSGGLGPYCEFDAAVGQGSFGQGGQQQKIQQCKLQCVSQGQSPQQCQRRCSQQLSGGGSGGGFGGEGFGPYGQLDAVVDQGRGGQGGQLQQLHKCQLQCVSQGQSSSQCMQRCIQQLSGTGMGGRGFEIDAVEDSSRQQQQLKKFRQCQRSCQSQAQSQSEQMECQSRCMQQMQQGGTGSGSGRGWMFGFFVEE